MFISYWDRKSLRLTLLTNLPQHSWASSHYPRIPALCGQKLVLPEVGLWVNPLRKLTINRSTSIAWVDEPRLICFTLRRITSITSRMGPIRPRSLRPSFLVLSCKSRVASPLLSIRTTLYIPRLAPGHDVSSFTICILELPIYCPNFIMAFEL